MNKKRVIIGGFLLLLVLSALSVTNTIRLNHGVMKSWMQLEREFERRSDLIPNLAVLVPDHVAPITEAIGEMVDYRLAAVGNQRRVAPREPGYLGAIKSLPFTRFVIGSEHFLRDTTRFYSYFEAQYGITGAASRLITASAGLHEQDTSDSFCNVVRLLDGTAPRIERSVSQFSNSANIYNRSVTSFPGRIYSGWLGFDPVLVTAGR